MITVLYVGTFTIFYANDKTAEQLDQVPLLKTLKEFLIETQSQIPDDQYTANEDTIDGLECTFSTDDEEEYIDESSDEILTFRRKACKENKKSIAATCRKINAYNDERFGLEGGITFQDLEKQVTWNKVEQHFQKESHRVLDRMNNYTDTFWNKELGQEGSANHPTFKEFFDFVQKLQVLTSKIQ